MRPARAVDDEDHQQEVTVSARIGINGFGRIGRDYLRYLLEAQDTDLEVVAVNDVFDSATMARLLRYDSTFGPLRRDVEDLGDAIAVDGHKNAVSAERDPAQLAWRDHGVEDADPRTGGRSRRRPAGGTRVRHGRAAHLTSKTRRMSRKNSSGCSNIGRCPDVPKIVCCLSGACKAVNHCSAGSARPGASY